jgi:hypothetical protein
MKGALAKPKSKEAISTLAVDVGIWLARLEAGQRS